MNQALKVAMAAAEQLPPRLRRVLAQRLLSSSPTQDTTLILLHRLPAHSQARLALLVDKNSEGTLTAAERKELRSLSEKADRFMLRNSQALAQAVRPDLFNARGKPIQSRFRRR